MESSTSAASTWPWPDSLDGVVAAPGSHRVLFENEYTRALEVTIEPGVREPEHTHRRPSIMVVLQPARIRYCTGDTLTLPHRSDPPPPTPAREPTGSNPEGPHSVENIDDRIHGAFRIEFKQL